MHNVPQLNNIVGNMYKSIETDRMQFDYRLRPGVCPTTNALKIMQQEGLPIGPPLAAGTEAE